MLRVAAASAALLTVLETIVLYSMVRADPLSLAVAVGLFNAVLAVVVGRLSMAHLGYHGKRSAAALGGISDPLTVLREGLNRETARETVRMLAQLDNVRGVVVAERQEVLASEGPAFEDPQVVEVVRQVLRDVRSRGGAVRRALSGVAVVAAPLVYRRDVLGALGFVVSGNGESVNEVARAAEVFARLLAMQLALAQMDQQARLAAEAELRALQAQINPHFFFNTLNTVVSYMRDDPEMARRLLLRLADLFRMN
ncbi:MAG: histidine kinase, partial [Armatimonadota bacterium]|nr:histidine kinase [Armatimonadota bacterium]